MKKAVVIAMLVVLVTGTAACGSKKDAVNTKETNEINKDARISDEKALEAIKNYCIQTNPELEDMVNSKDYTIDWKVESSEEDQIVVAYRSYTAAIVRYYIHPLSGETYVTEFVPGITEEEKRTDETLNVKDYME
jgi:hypothetical protein